VHDRVEAVVTVVDAEQGINGLAVVSEIDAGEAGASFTDNIEGMDIITGIAEALHDSASEFSAGARDSNSHGIS